MRVVAAVVIAVVVVMLVAVAAAVAVVVVEADRSGVRSVRCLKQCYSGCADSDYMIAYERRMISFRLRTTTG
ncbi:hypothetical protein F5B17DRAFT_418122 [Nemania serpens]|nr:hypothetical protein F5B17DRAFT_418122 [Nemania serpens]